MDDTPGEAMSTKSEVTESSSALSVNDQVDECYICCEGASLAPLVRGVCACRGTAMHVACQQRMLDSAVAVDAGQLTLCRVCRTSFSNAEIYTYWYPSTACTVWCAWVMGAFVMLWSANTVLDEGASNDLRLVCDAPHRTPHPQPSSTTLSTWDSEIVAGASVLAAPALGLPATRMLRRRSSHPLHALSELSLGSVVAVPV